MRYVTQVKVSTYSVVVHVRLHHYHLFLEIQDKLDP
jgi:hypothetical protein